MNINPSRTTKIRAIFILKLVVFHLSYAFLSQIQSSSFVAVTYFSFSANRSHHDWGMSFFQKVEIPKKRTFVNIPRPNDETKLRAISTDILDFRERVLAIDGHKARPTECDSVTPDSGRPVYSASRAVRVPGVRSGSVGLNNFPRYISGLRADCGRCRVVHGVGRRMRRPDRRRGPLEAHREGHLTQPPSWVAARPGTFQSA